MLLKLKLCLLFLILVEGLFGVDADEMKSVSVMEGGSVTLHTDVTELQTEDHILWIFGPQETLIAKLIKQTNVVSIDYDERFRDRLKLDSQTGSLIITHMRISDSGLYKLQISRIRGTSYKRFNVTVYAPLPVPVISRDSSQCSSSSERSSVCVLLCSVLNVSHVSLSWYNGSSLLSSISVSDLNIRLSLPLEVDYDDNSTYTCVLNNTITNHTQHLHINDVCHKCSDETGGICSHVYALTAAVLGVLVVLVVIVAVKRYQISRESGEHSHEEEGIPMNPLNGATGADRAAVSVPNGVQRSPYFWDKDMCFIVASVPWQKKAAIQEVEPVSSANA